MRKSYSDKGDQKNLVKWDRHAIISTINVNKPKRTLRLGEIVLTVSSICFCTLHLYQHLSPE